MYTTAAIFETERLGDVLILTPRRELRELEYQEIQDELLPLIDDPLATKVIVDFGRTSYLGSTALGLLARLALNLRERGGKLVLCNVSAREREIFGVAGLVGLWPIFASREEALAAMSEGESSPARREEEDEFFL